MQTKVLSQSLEMCTSAVGKDASAFCLVLHKRSPKDECTDLSHKAGRAKRPALKQKIQSYQGKRNNKYYGFLDVILLKKTDKGGATSRKRNAMARREIRECSPSARRSPDENSTRSKTKKESKTKQESKTKLKGAESSPRCYLSLHQHYRFGDVPVDPRHPGEPHQVLVFPRPEQPAQLDRIKPPLRVSREGAGR